MNHVKMSDFENSDGRMDWNAYRDAQKENGDRCQLCGGYQGLPIFGRNKGVPVTCQGCRDMSSNDAVWHHRLVRCPKCRHHWEPEEIDITSEDFEACCDMCDHEFTVGILLDVQYESPEIGDRSACQP